MYINILNRLCGCVLRVSRAAGVSFVAVGKTAHVENVHALQTAKLQPRTIHVTCMVLF